eukprot:GHVL01024118.1.p1 GENE.GHVL01024118.1~~GHVL01024118.1.p1  ORF type:complete len:376 (+),score=45.32 GHVL01024118.1:55-1182(+)
MDDSSLKWSPFDANSSDICIAHHVSRDYLTSPESPFEVVEHIQKLTKRGTEHVRDIFELPKDVDTLVWEYEHLRQFVIEFNQLILFLQNSCTVDTCPKMTASHEWQFLCATHCRPQDCAAMDYMIHSLEGSTALLSSMRSFPKRGRVSKSTVKHLQNSTRRLYRIFAHVYFHHEDKFTDFEKQTHMCARFSYFAIKFNLMQLNVLFIPPQAFLQLLPANERDLPELEGKERHETARQDITRSQETTLDNDSGRRESYLSPSLRTNTPKSVESMSPADTPSPTSSPLGALDSTSFATVVSLPTTLHTPTSLTSSTGLHTPTSLTSSTTPVSSPLRSPVSSQSTQRKQKSPKSSKGSRRKTLPNNALSAQSKRLSLE